MNCQQCQERLVAYAEDLLDSPSREALRGHLESCPSCRALADDHARLRDRLIDSSRQFSSEALDDEVMKRIFREQTLELRRNAMRPRFRRYGKIGFGLAAAAAIVLVAFVGFGSLTTRRVSAAEVFSRAINAMQSLEGVYIKLSVRNLPYDNFELIGLDYDFIPIEMWKQFGDAPRWRVEKEGRISVMDGQQTLNLIKPNKAFKQGPMNSFDAWLGRLMDVDAVLEQELERAENQGWPCSVQELDGQLVVTIEAPAQGADYANDYLLNTSIYDAATRRVYRFGADSELLESLQVFVHPDGDKEEPAADVLVFEVVQIEYDPLMDDNQLFTLELPQDVIWYEQPQVLPDNPKYEEMSPQQVALAFFRACSEENWDEVLKFYPSSEIDSRMKGYLAGLEIVSIGTPFQSGSYPGWFVPYEIKLKIGETKNHNLALRCDNPAGRFVVDGGI